MNTLDIIKELHRNIPEIEAFSFHKFPKQKLLQERITFNKIEDDQFKEALSIRAKYNLPFWDSIMLTYFNKKEVSNQILKNALTHNPIEDKFWINDLNSINEILHNETNNIAFNSRVKLKTGEYKHLPLLDFHIPNNMENKQIVIKVIDLLGFSNGYIMESGESYHFIGSNLINDDELILFLSKALLFSPIIDRAWIAHQLLERSTSLRITYKHKILPNLIHRIT